MWVGGGVRGKRKRGEWGCDSGGVAGAGRGI